MLSLLSRSGVQRRVASRRVSSFSSSRRTVVTATCDVAPDPRNRKYLVDPFLKRLDVCLEAVREKTTKVKTDEDVLKWYRGASKEERENLFLEADKMFQRAATAANFHTLFKNIGTKRSPQEIEALEPAKEAWKKTPLGEIPYYDRLEADPKLDTMSEEEALMDQIIAEFEFQQDVTEEFPKEDTLLAKYPPPIDFFRAADELSETHTPPGPISDLDVL